MNSYFMSVMISIIDYKAGNLTSVKRALDYLNIESEITPDSNAILDAVNIPVIASGGGGKPEHLFDVLTRGGADAALIASMLHYIRLYDQGD